MASRISKGMFFLIICLSCAAYGQETGISVIGQVIDSDNQKPIEFATVRALDPTTNKVISGGNASFDGKFSFQIATEDFYLEVSFLGYETLRIDKIKIVNQSLYLGQVSLKADSKQLEEVVVRGEKSDTEFALDKRIFNVGKDISSTGMSAFEVLNNVPSVNVNIEGEISLRGSTGVQVLINGKPSVLTSDESNGLGTITAEMIERVEVITNPSAKYDAEGTSGIINIVIKKEERKGTNGSISLNTGTPHNHSIGLSLNRRTEHFNLFTQLGVGYKETPTNVKSINTNNETGVSIISEGLQYRNENFYNFILGTDYHVNKYNVITVSGHYAYEIEDQPSRTDFSSTDANQDITSEWKRTEVTEAYNPKYQYELNYTKEYRDNPEEHTLILSALGNFFGKDLSSEFENETVLGDDQDSNQRTETDFKEGKYTFKLDYTHPFSDIISMELGAQYLINDVSNDYEVSDLIADEWVIDGGLTNVFNYNLKVLGTYITGSYKGEKWGYKAGLRVENTNLGTFLETTGDENNQRFANLFPSFHTSYKLNHRVSLQAGYSRRIYRPRLWDLNPFFNIRDNFTIRTGNPDLLPEFSDSYELSTISELENMSLNLTVYHRYTTDVKETISVFENNTNTTRPYNIGTKQSTGVEINGKYDPIHWLSINGDFNYFYFNRRGQFESTNFDFSDSFWSSKLVSKFKLPWGIDLELTGRYISEYQTIQSTVSENLYMDIGARKKILNGKGVISASVRDVFASRVREVVTDQSDFYVFSSRRRGSFFTLGFSYGFGKGEAMQYSGKR